MIILVLYNFIMDTVEPIAIALIYGFVGYKLNKNYILWGLMGLGIFIAPSALSFTLMSVESNPVFGLVLLPFASWASTVISLLIVGIIAYRNNSVFKKQL
jgi:hypothetical protein